MSNRSAQPLDISEIQKATKNFDDSLVIGRGYLGAVYRGEVSNSLAAIKRLDSNSKIGASESWPEVNRLSTLRNHNLVSLIGYVKDAKLKRRSWKLPSQKKPETILVYEYISNGTLRDHLHVRRTPFSCLQRLNICIGVVRGLHYLHSNGVMHGDLRSSNILLTETWEPKVADYGLSKMCKGSVLVFDVPDGAFGYWDPHSFVTQGLTMKSDMYFFAVVLLEVLCRIPALDETRVGTQRSLVLRFQESGLEDIIDPEVKDDVSSDCLKTFSEIAQRCLQERAQERPNMYQVLELLVALKQGLNNPSS